MNVAFQRNVGSFLKAVTAAGTMSSVVAGSGDDGTAVAGVAIDRNDILPVVLSAMPSFVVDVDGLGANETVEVAISAQDSENGSDWDPLDIGPPDDYTPTVLTEEGLHTVSRKAQLGAARRYVRFTVTLTFSAGSSDNAQVLGGVAVLAGADEIPIADRVEPAPSS